MNNRNSGELAGVAPQDSVDKNAAVKSQKILSEDSAHYILIKNNEREPENDNQEAGKGRSYIQLILRISYFLTFEVDYFSSFFSDIFYILFLLSLTMVVYYLKDKILEAEACIDCQLLPTINFQLYYCEVYIICITEQALNHCMEMNAS